MKDFYVPTVNDLLLTLEVQAGYYDPEKIGIKKVHKTHAPQYSLKSQKAYRERQKLMAEK